MDNASTSKVMCTPIHCDTINTNNYRGILATTDLSMTHEFLTESLAEQRTRAFGHISRNWKLTGYLTIIIYHIVVPGPFAISVGSAIRLESVASSAAATAATNTAVEFVFRLVVIDVVRTAVMYVRSVHRRVVALLVFDLCHGVLVAWNNDRTTNDKYETADKCTGEPR